MKHVVFGAILLTGLGALVMGCSEDEDNPMITGTDPRGPRSTRPDAGQAPVDAGTVEDAPPAPGLDDSVNGCTLQSAEDLRGNPEALIVFGGPVGATYQPGCIVVAPGAKVTFRGDFVEDPLVGGYLVQGGYVRQPDGPIGEVDRGDEAVIEFTDKGAYGFLSESRGFEKAMSGAVFVTE